MAVGAKIAGKLQPAIIKHDNHTVFQYRGLQYGTVSRRFAEPEAMSIDDLLSRVDCKHFGPICPQIPTDFHHLLRVPEALATEEPAREFDEFACLNLDITVPVTPTDKLPVMIWIHGGSQTMTFMPASSPCADMIPFVAASAAQGQPVITVFVNYRLNVFAFGDMESSKNLALKDQRLAIEWVSKHVGEFGGDPTNITLAGESAGAVFVHAHVVTRAPVKRAILQSGSLYLSPPQPEARRKALCDRLGIRLGKEGYSLVDAPVDVLLETLSQANVVSLWLEMTDELRGWKTELGRLEALLVGDVEYESVIWRNGIESHAASDIVECFNTAAQHATQLKQAYGIVEDRPTACKIGALDFINDTRFALPVLHLSDLFLQAGLPAYTYTFDQANPWQQSSRAHHAVDLIMLFGNLDFTHNPGAALVRGEMRKKWTEFCHGEAPWPSHDTYAFGPYGRCGVIPQNEHRDRRRLHACRLLSEIGSDTYDSIFARLAAGRISLLN